MNEAIPHILTDKEGRGYDIIEMTPDQAQHQNDYLKATKSIYSWVAAENPASIAYPAPGATSRENTTSESSDKPDLSEVERGGLNRAGRIFDKFTVELEHGLNFRRVIAELPEDTLDLIEAILDRIEGARK